jgi:hypothetical protein
VSSSALAKETKAQLNKRVAIRESIIRFLLFIFSISPIYRFLLF